MNEELPPFKNVEHYESASTFDRDINPLNSVSVDKWLLATVRMCAGRTIQNQLVRQRVKMISTQMLQDNKAT